MQTTSSTPLAANSFLVRMKLGMWAEWQVGVNAPGTPKITTRRPSSIGPSSTFSGPSAPMRSKVAPGSLSPSSIALLVSATAMSFSFSVVTQGHNVATHAGCEARECPVRSRNREKR